MPYFVLLSDLEQRSKKDIYQKIKKTSINLNNSLRAGSESEYCFCDTMLTLYPQNPKQFMVWTKLWSKFHHIYLSFANFATKLAGLKFNLVTQMSMEKTKINVQATLRLKLFI